MIERFTAEESAQREWAWLLALYLFFGSLGACLFLLVRLSGLPRSFLFVAIGLVVCGAIAILFKLGSPQRAWRAISRPTTSWISRGAWFVGGFFVFAFLTIAPSFAAFSWLPWNEGTSLGAAFSWIAAAFALLTALYPGFVVSNARAIPFWDTPLIPLLFFTYAALAAIGIVLIGAAPADVARFTPWAESLIVGNAVLTAIYLLTMKRAGGSAAESVHRLTRGSLGAVYWGAVVVVGLILPLAALLWPTPAAALAGAGIGLGALLFRYCVLRAGLYYAPAAFVPPQVDFSTLTRTSADFAREYAGMTHGRR